MATKRYNGHRSWNSWNVSLWISNDEGLYNLARECKREAIDRPRPNTRAAEAFIALVGATHTPDGAPYNLRCVTEAIAGLD